MYSQNLRTFLTVGITSILLVSCSTDQENTKKETPVVKQDVEITPELAIKSARLAILNQLPDPGSTTFDIESTSQLNDTLFSIMGSFTTRGSGGGLDKVGFDCKIGLTRDGQSFQLLEINTDS